MIWSDFSFLDAILIFILGGFIFYGLFFGLIRSVGSLLGLIVGAWLASKYYLVFYSWAKNLFFGRENLGKFICFILILIIINRLINLVFAIINKMYNVIAIIPFLKTINRLAGAVFGFLQGGLLLGLILLLITQYLPFQSWSIWLNKSQLAPFLIEFVKTIGPLVPELLSLLKS